MGHDICDKLLHTPWGVTETRSNQVSAGSSLIEARNVAKANDWNAIMASDSPVGVLSLTASARLLLEGVVDI